MKNKLIRTTTIPLSLDKLLEGQLNYLNKYYKVVGVSGEGEELRVVEKRECVQVIPVKMERKIAPINDIVSLWKLYKLFKKEKPLIVHSITPKAGLLSMVAAYLVKVPIRMHTFTGLIFPSKKGLFQKLLITMDKVLCKFATHIYPEGKGVKNDLLGYGITSKPLKILANGNVNGINTSYFNPVLFAQTQNETLKEQLGIAKDDFVFIFVGRLVGDKGINELVKAFREISRKSKVESQKSHSSAAERSRSQITVPTTNNQQPTNNSKLKTQHLKLLLVGPLETELDPLLPETLEEISNNQHIISVGWQQDVRSYFAISNVLVFPSYREGFPNVVLQAGAMGLPSIVTDINGCNEIITHGENGWIIPVKDTKAILKAMKHILLNKEAYIKAKTTTRQLIKDKFEQQLVWEALLEEYRLCESKSLKV